MQQTANNIQDLKPAQTTMFNIPCDEILFREQFYESNSKRVGLTIYTILWKFQCYTIDPQKSENPKDYTTHIFRISYDIHIPENKNGSWREIMHKSVFCAVNSKRPHFCPLLFSSINYSKSLISIDTKMLLLLLLKKSLNTVKSAKAFFSKLYPKFIHLKYIRRG